jgi:uncharacterized protein (TIGR02300 family)
LANPELGAKQICPSCSTKFYDLTRRPAVCPKCATEFDPEEAIRNRRVRARAVLPDDDVVVEKPVKAEETEDGFEVEADEAPELDETIPVEPLDTEDADADGAPATSDDAIGVDFAEDEDIEDSDDDEVPFLEEDDEDFPEDEIDGLPEEGDRDD